MSVHLSGGELFQDIDLNLGFRRITLISLSKHSEYTWKFFFSDQENELHKNRTQDYNQQKG